MRNWSGIICIEGEQTGDGRLIAEGALEWSDPPLPLGWLEEQMHGDLLSGGVQIGTIDTITRDGVNIRATGAIDDDTEQGAEICRRMDAGTAPHGEAFYVSIDPDDWEVELIATDTEEDEDGGGILLIAGAGPPPTFSERARSFAAAAFAAARAFFGAAGDGDPEDEGTVLFTDSADSIIERYTRMRIRGATLLAVPALDDAFITLDGAAGESSTDDEEAPAETPAEEDEPAAEAAAASATVTPITSAGRGPTDPPPEWFENPAFGRTAEEDERLVRLEHSLRGEAYACPFTVTEDGRVFGHVAPWDVCHIGDETVCRTAPNSPSDYAYFRTGALPPECGCDIPVGNITLGTGHADLSLSARDTAAHYDHTGTVVADVVSGEDDHGIWVAGALRPNVTDEQLRNLAAASLSGDWRRIGGHLEMVAALAVNVPGFPIPRVQARVASGVQTALVAAGVPDMARVKADPDHAWRSDIERRLAAAERVTQPLRSDAQRALAASVTRD